MGDNIKRFNVPIAEFFDGNSEDYEGNVLKTYTIKATSSNGNTVEIDINSKFLTRQALNGGVQFTPMCQPTLPRVHLSTRDFVFKAYVGLFADGEKAMDDGKHSYASANQRQFVGQQTYSLEISKEDGSESVTPILR